MADCLPVTGMSEAYTVGFFDVATSWVVTFPVDRRDERTMKLVVTSYLEHVKQLRVAS